jgi:hypothetical protein
MPTLRKPADLHEILWGGWTCEHCGAKMNRRGKLRKITKEKVSQNQNK